MSLAALSSARLLPQCASDRFWYLAVFLVTFLRFFWGDNRLLDAKYKEVIAFLDDLSEEHGEDSEFYDAQFEKVLRNYSLRFIVLDAGFVILHGVFFALLALSVTEPFLFIYGYIFLLLFNSVWLLIVEVFSVGFYYAFWNTFLGRKGLRGDITASLAPWRWAVNNLVHAGALVWLFARNSNQINLFGFDLTLLNWCLILMFSNCAFDFLLTWTAYFPRIRAIYYDLITNGKGKALPS